MAERKVVLMLLDFLDKAETCAQHRDYEAWFRVARAALDTWGPGAWTEIITEASPSPSTPRLQHMGLTLWMDSTVPQDEELTRAARASFPDSPKRFPSALLQKELDAAHSGFTLDVTVFKAYSKKGAGAPACELLLVLPGKKGGKLPSPGMRTSHPSVHIAFDVMSEGQFLSHAEILIASGFDRLGAGPEENSHEKMALCYFDRRIEGRRLRVELCYPTTPPGDLVGYP